MYQIGHTKVYFSSIMMEKLEHTRLLALNCYIILIQKHYRRYNIHTWYKNLLKNTIKVQSMLRRLLYMTKLKNKLKNIYKIQLHARTALYRQRYIQRKKHIIATQAMFRMALYRRRFKIFREKMRREKDLNTAKAAYELQMSEEREKYKRDAHAREEQQRQQEEVLRQQAIEAELKLEREKEAARVKEEELRLQLLQEQEALRRYDNNDVYIHLYAVIIMMVCMVYIYAGSKLKRLKRSCVKSKS